MGLLALCYVIVIAIAGYLLYDKRRFEAERNAIDYRIHVNGIRGKSSVTRYVSAVLRDAGFETYGKTTGTEARVILPDGRDAAVARPGHANVNEQVGIIRSFAARGARAIVMECMAINPDYQDWLESRVMHSQITIITNVRIDHQEEMGETLLDIARSLSRSIPRKSILITAETQPEVLAIFQEECDKKHAQLFVAKADAVTAADLAKFGHVAHADNVTIGLTVAELFNIPHERAVKAMAGAPPDPGAFHLEHIPLFGKEVVWANLFAVNDKESFAQLAVMLARNFPDHHRIVMLNNRYDRPSRVEMFCELAQNEFQANTVVALGDYEERVRAAIQRQDITVALMGNESKYASANGNRLLRTIVGLTRRPKVLLVGTVNIHTHQSEHILAELSKYTGDKSFAAVPFYDPRPARWFSKKPSGHTVPARAPLSLNDGRPVTAGSEGPHVY